MADPLVIRPGEGKLHWRWRGMSPLRKFGVALLAFSIVGFGSWRFVEWWMAWPARMVLPMARWGRPWAYSPDGLIVAASSSDANELVFWKMATGTRQATLTDTDHRYRFSGAFSPDGRTYASPWVLQKPPRSFEVDLVDPATAKVRSTFASPLSGFLGIRFRDDGAKIRLVISDPATFLPSVVEFDVASGQLDPVRPLSCPPIKGFSGLSSDGRFLAIIPFNVAINGPIAVTVWDLDEDREAVALPPIVGRIIRSAVCFSPDGRTLAIGLEDGSIQLWDLAGRVLVRTIRGHRANYGSMILAFSPDGSILSSMADLNNLALSIDLARLLIARHIGDPDQQLVELVLFDVKTGQALARSQEDGVTVFSPDSRTVLTTHEGGSIWVHDVPRTQAEAR